ncbi:MAG: MarR family winged helix-turn-helix transcriptional regulator [Vulcanimicrobiota bacterium]
MSTIPDDEPDLLFDKLTRIMAILHRGQKPRDVGFEPVNSRVMILAHLMKKENPRMGDLAAVMGITVPSLTGMIKKMEEEKLLERQPDSSDGRVVRVHLSETGKRTIEGFFAEKRQKWAQMISPLSREERQRFGSLLDEMCALLRKTLKKD